MAILQQDIDRVVYALSPTQPRSEQDLKTVLLQQGMGETRIEIAVSEAHHRNLIRWVAFAGWLRGGRPV